MKKNNEIKTVVPALRFPEFQDTESWYNDIVNNLVDIITPPKKIILQEYLNEGDYPIVDQSQKYISGWTNDKTAVISKASLANPIIIFGDHTCILKRITFPFAQGADGIKVLKSKDTIDGNFLYQALLVCPIVQEEYKRHFSILKQKEVFFPSIKSGEQQKIADCLSSLDDLIEATAQKVDALKEHKKGLTQRLFPKEGENVPELRFPEFQEKEGWKNNIVSNLTSVITAPKKITSHEYLNTGNYPIIDQSQNYICGWTNDERAIITEASLNQPLIIFGDHTCILKKVTFPFAQGADGIKILKTKECINGFFLYQVLLVNAVTQEEYKRHYSILKEKTIYYPIINSGEQQKIADCLSSLDELIEVTSQKVEILKEHKRSLMQQLFPKI